MHSLPDGLQTDQGPPVTIPFQHFVVALVFLVAGIVGGLAMAVTSLPGLDSVAHVHILLVGWICLTIMGAMTQFVPVWSGVALHSRRLARIQLLLVAGGLAGFVVSLLTVSFTALPLFGACMLVGLWLFVYNVGRTLLTARPFDFTERHFAIALVSFAALAPLGLSLAIDFATPVFDGVALTRGDVIAVHVTLAVFGGVVATIVGALAQLVKMFTQTETDVLYHRLETVEQLTFPAGLVALTVGRGVGSASLAAIGGLGVLLGLFAIGLVLVHRLSTATTDPSPMTDRYWIVAASLLAWIGLTAPVWVFDPVGSGALLGHPDATNLLVFGVFGFVVVGTLYHIVPFIIWIEQYSDRLGLEQVPMIDDLYSSRIERIDFVATGLGFAGMVAGDVLGVPTAFVVGAAVLATIGFCLFVVNMLLTIVRHNPSSLGPFGSLGRRWVDSDGESATSGGTVGRSGE